MQNTNYSLKRRKSEDEEEETPQSDKHLGYFTKIQHRTILNIPIDEPIRDAHYYRQVAKAIADTEEHDQIEFEISSPGGMLDGLISILTAMTKTDATTIAHINGECHSAASILALNCDAIYVSPYATMLVHFVRFGASGKSTDVRLHVEHVHQTSQELFKDTYKYFLTEDEIQRCIDGLELWLSSDQIQTRLKRKFELMDQELQEESSDDDILQAAQEEKPKRVRKKSTPEVT